MGRDDIEKAISDIDEAVSDIDEALGTVEKTLPHLELIQTAEQHPDQLVSRLPELIDQLESDDSMDRNTAAGAVGYVAIAKPGAVEPYLSTLAPYLETTAGSTKQNLLAIFNSVANENSSAIEPHVDQLLSQIEHDDITVRVYAALAIGKLADRVPDKHLFARLLSLLLTDVLQDGTSEDLHNLTIAIAHLSEVDPTATVPMVDQVSSLLNHDRATIRQNVVEILGNMQVVEVRETFKDLLGDDDKEVRKAALEALRQTPETEAERAPELTTAKTSFDPPITRSRQTESSAPTADDRYEMQAKELRRSLVRGL